MWKYGFSSIAGTSHARLSLPVQDACAVEVVNDTEGNEILIAVASDGAGSAARSQLGSELTCRLFVDEIKSHFAASGTLAQLADGFIEAWVDKFQRIVMGRSEEEQVAMPNFACTLLATVIGREQVAYFQLGDGAIVASHRDEQDRYHCVCWPQQGEYANTTNFLTDVDAADKIFRELKPGVVDEVALFTDGIQGLVLNYHARSAHAPFFAPLFAWLRPRGSGYSQELSDSLAAYLSSEKINSRTDDDKTLILATRRQN